ncbi:MAG: hypothetical protein IH614_00635 [Desulfuromonadales bacterium]|nr:hypothetical protein [Desulfuromonadales bacterium]
MAPPSSPEVAAGQLTLVGTVHRQPGNAVGLPALLQELAPDAITLEVSPFAIHWRLAVGPRLLARLEKILDRFSALHGVDRGSLEKHPQVVGIRSLLALPEEFRGAAGYAGPRGVPLALIDLSAVSARKLRRVETELVTWENLSMLLTLPPALSPGEDYLLARRLLAGKVALEVRQAFLAGRRGREGIGVRDAIMAREIRRRRPRGHLVHVGGWVHLLADEQGETLFSRLAELKPGRRLLDPF